MAEFEARERINFLPVTIFTEVIDGLPGDGKLCSMERIDPSVITVEQRKRSRRQFVHGRSTTYAAVLQAGYSGLARLRILLNWR